MARIPLVPRKQAPWWLRMLYRYAVRRFGAVPEPFMATANHPGLLLTNASHEWGFEKTAKTLPANVRDIAVYRVAWQVGCSWCVDFGTMLQRLQGLDTERLKWIDQYETSPHYSRPERLAIRYADAMTASPMTVTDEQVAELVDEFGVRGTVELTYAIALENHRARMNSALGITDQGFASGDACRIPVPGEAAASAGAK